MRLSIVIPALNEAANIAAALQPLQAMRSRGAEVILVDGGSGDSTRQTAIAHVDRVIDSARGRARQMNAGAKIAQGDVLLFLHADSILPADADLSIVDALNSKTHNWGRFDVSITGSHFLFPVIGWFMNQRSRLSGIATGDQGLFITADAFGKVGGFADIPLMEDVAICAALKKISAPVCLRQSIATSGRRWERHGVWRTVFLMWRIRFAYFLGADPAILHRDYYGAK